MVLALLEKYPSTEYRSIIFEVFKPESQELCKLVESFKYSDGQYHYDGNFVSREWLEKELSQKDYKVSMSVYIAEGDPSPAPEEKYFSPQQVREMSPRELHDNFEAIKKSMDKWN